MDVEKEVISSLKIFAVLAIFTMTGCVHHINSARVPPPPVTYACSVSPSSIYPGDPITVTGTPVNLDPAKPQTYAWRADGVHLAGSGPSVTIDTAHYESGSHVIQGTVSEGTVGGTADCSAQFTVKAFEPPTISCAVSSATARPGEQVSVTASGVSPGHRPLVYSYSSSLGSMSGNTAVATLSTTGTAPGDNITVSCNIVDDKGQYATATTSVQIVPGPLPPPPQSIAPQCIADPATVRPGQRVTFKVAQFEILAGDQVRWRTSVSPESLDQDRGIGVFDTGHLPPGSYTAMATITGGGMVRGCTAHFTIDLHASGQDWPSISQSSRLLLPDDVENSGFALYTYVLTKAQPTTADDKLRLHNIVKQVLAYGTAEDQGQDAVQAEDHGQPQPHAAHPPAHRINTPASQLGVIYIPVRESYAVAKDSAGDPLESEATWIVDQDHYDAGAASALLLRLGCLNATPNCRGKLSGDGPYLISTLISLKTHRPQSVLIQNLQGTDAQVAGDWVGRFVTVASRQKNWTGRTLDNTLVGLGQDFDNYGQTMFLVGTVKTQVLAIFGLGRQ
jgi:hypothetical protein